MTTMMNRLHLFLALAAITAFSLTSCDQKEGCTDPNALNYDAESELDNGSCVYDAGNYELSLHFNSKLGSADFAYNTDAINWEGRKMRFTRAQFYVSKVQVANTPFDNTYLLVIPEVESYSIGSIMAGDHQDFRFMVGVDSSANHLDPALRPSGHALSSTNPNFEHWGWDPGYIFIALEGLVDTTADKTGEANSPFLYHIATDQLASHVVLQGHFSVSGNTTITVGIDWLKFFHSVDLRANPMTHSMGNNMTLPMAVTTNVPSVFTLE